MQRNLYNLTYPQKTIWYTEEVFKGTPISNITGTVIISKEVNFDFLSQAINIFVERNYNYRLRFMLDNKQIKQYVEPYKKFELKVVNVTTDLDLKKIENEISSTVFDIFNSFLYSFTLIKYPDNHGGFIYNAHHLISDAWTSGVTASEIIKIYGYLINGKETDDICYPSYTEYINSENEYLKSQRYIKDKAFWDNQFSTIPEIATLPGTSTVSNSESSCASQRKQFVINKDLINRISDFCKSNKISLYDFFMSVYAIYIGKVSGLDEFVIGSPILNRSNIREKHTCGMFINTVPVKIILDNQLSFADFVSKIASNFFDILKHQKYQYLSILEDLRHKDNTIPNLYNILISYQNIRSTAQTSEIPFNINWIHNNNISDDIDIHIFDLNDTGSFNIAYDYRLSKYSENNIQEIHTRILNIINQVLSNAKLSLNDIEIITPDEKRVILSNFNDTKVSYNKDKTISTLIEEQALATPDRIAIAFENKEMTYKELNEKSNSLANLLRFKGIKPNDIVGIMVNRSFEMLVSILAVLKAGGAYIPIDPEYPQDRIEYMLNNSDAKYLLTFSKLDTKVNFERKIFVELDNTNVYASSSKHVNCVNLPNDSSYVIYTSGSTGTPKGVVLNHKALSNLTNYCKNYVEYLKDNTYRTIASVTTISFDIFIFETLISLTCGLKVVIANEDEQNIPRLLNNLIEKYNISIIQTTPARMQIFVNNYAQIPALKNLKYITLAGEQLPITLANKLKEICGAKIYNGYGPSETTVFSTLTDVTNYETITIGKPLDNTQIYILDNNLNVLPIGSVGEIYIAGDGLGKGYLNRPDLTAKSFIPNPFLKGTLMYKTGDLGSYRPDGEILCLGRADNQVKIRGLRIELEEIEHKILDNKNITNCVVAKKTDSNSHEFLCAYYTAVNDIDINELRNHLSSALPKYMVPQFFMKLDALPYTPNGKVNRKVLPLPKPVKTVKQKIEPRNTLDKDLIDLIEQILDVKDININDSFLEIGGDSLSAITLCTALYDIYSIDVSVKEIFEHSNLMNLSDLIAKKSKNNNAYEFFKCPNQDSYPVSSIQKSIYYSSIIAGNNSLLYNVPGGLLLDKMPDIQKLETCLQTLIDRHETLRTYFEIENETLVQKIANNIIFKLEKSDTAITENEIDQCFKTFVRPFDLSTLPLIRAKLVEIKESEKHKAILFIDIHHIVCDGASLQILVKELCELYNNQTLNPLTASYKDFVWTELQYQNSKNAQEARTYFASELNGNLPLLNIISSNKRPNTQSFDGNKVYFSADSGVVSKIEKICIEYEITPYMFTLACYYILLYKYTAQNDIIIGSPIIGRKYLETSNLIGMFVNTLPTRMNIDTSKTFKEFVLEVKNKCLNNYKYQLYPFDALLKDLKIKRNPSRNPIFDTIFTFQNKKSLNIKLGDINYETYSNDINISKYDISLEIIPNGNTYNMNFEYCTNLFTKDFIEQISHYYLNILNSICEHINTKIQDIVTVESSDIISDTASPIKEINLSPRNDVDKKLIEIFKALIDADILYVSDSLFDLGGDSLTAINLCTRIYDVFQIQLSVKDIFEHPIIMDLSDLISSKTSTVSNIEKAPDQASYPVSYAEQSIYFASILAGNNSITYNIPCGLLLDKMPDIQKLEKCFKILIKRHEILRTYFDFNKNDLVQKIKKNINFRLDVEETAITESEIDTYYSKFLQPFNLSNAPLFRIKLARISDSEKYQALLLLDIHHIICDGTSLQILVHDLCLLYNSEQLPELSLTYKDYAWNESKLLKGNDLNEMEDYWVSQFKKGVPVLRMPTSFPRPAVQSFSGSAIEFSVDKDLTNKIEDICKELEITPYILTLAAYYILLYNYTAQEEIIIGSPMNGRIYPETNDIIGMFVNTLPIKTKINTDKSIKNFILSLKEICMNVYKYQAYPFELLVKKLNLARDTSRNPLFDTIFTFQNTIDTECKFGDINAKYYAKNYNISKFDLSLEIIPTSNGYNMNFEYCTELFTKKFIQNLCNQYKNILNQIVANTSSTINSISMLQDSEELIKLSDTSLNEIEQCIYQYPNIDKAVVLLDDSNKITAYYSSVEQITINDLKAFIQRTLPSNFIPDFFVQVNKFKLDKDGKIDTNALKKASQIKSFEEPSTENQKLLAEIFKNVLKLDEININDNFFDIGGDSLFAIQLQIEAFNKGLEFSYRDIFTYPTIKQLAAHISNASSNIEKDNYDYTDINKLLSKAPNDTHIKRERIKNIFLTGATGYMGSHILENLLINTRCNIYCLIRKKNNTDPQTRLLNTLRFYFGTKYDRYIYKRVFVIEGDISSKNLGLKTDIYDRIGNSVSCVINSAAIVKHYGNSSIFNDTNIFGTQNIIDFCLKNNCKLIHLSTHSVSGNIFNTENHQVAEPTNTTIFSENSFYIGQDLSNIYINTKFIAERLILENIINKKLDAKIIRLGNITNRYSDGEFQINVSENAFLNKFHSFMQLKCVPDYLLDEHVEFTPVDLCAEAIVGLTFYNNSHTIFHVFNNNHITFRELTNLFKKLKIDIEIVSADEFYKRVKLFSNNPDTQNIISGIVNDFGKDKKLKYYTNIKIKNEFTNKVLSKLFFKWPKINKQYIKKYLKYLRSIGYIN